jgi:tetratricopeptide (TPR) repeat protein
MTEEVEVVVAGEESTPEVETPQYSEIEQQAIEQGWRPKAEWEGDETKWRDAKEFVERGELYSKIDTMGRDLKDTKKALKMLQEHHSKLKEVEYNKALTELKAAQKKNLESGDADAYLETTELLTDLKAEQKAREVYQESMPQTVDPRFTAWVDRNQWYAKEPAMKKYADLIGEVYARQNPDLEPVDVLDYVTKEIKVKFKDKFVNPNRNKPGAVEGSTNASTPSKKFEMSEDEVKVMNTFIRQKIMTKEEYIAELKKVRGEK